MTDEKGNSSDSSEMKFIIDGHEIIACFAEKENPEVFRRIWDILLNSDHVPHTFDNHRNEG